MPNRSKGRGQSKSDPTGPPGWGLGRGLITLSHEKKKKNFYSKRPYVPQGMKRIGEGEFITLKKTDLLYSLHQSWLSSDLFHFFFFFHPVISKLDSTGIKSNTVQK